MKSLRARRALRLILMAALVVLIEQHESGQGQTIPYGSFGGSPKQRTGITLPR
jgi:hypothetical protein